MKYLELNLDKTFLPVEIFQRRTNEIKKLIKHQYEKAGELLLALSKKISIYLASAC